MRRKGFVCLLATLCLIAAIRLNSRARQVTAEVSGHIEFIENQGQWDRGVRFLARRGSATAVVEQGTLTGNIVVGGTTVSRDFPTTPTAFHPTYNTPNATGRRRR